IQPVYGAQHPPLDPRLTKNFIKERSKVSTVPLKNKKASSFHEFARNTSDAWDIGDDEEEDFSSPAFQTLNSKVALATAAQVLENHSKLRVKPERSQSTTSDVPASYKVMKSSSDAQLSRNSSDSCLRNPLHKQQSLPLRPVIPLVARISDQNASGAPPMTVREKTRLEKFRQLLSSHNTDLDELRKCSWPGVPREVRPVTWRLLSIHIDIPRTNPLIPLFQQPLVQEIFERILFIWAIRHPASGYVQGINDLVTPFFVVFLSEYVGTHPITTLTPSAPLCAVPFSDSAVSQEGSCCERCFVMTLPTTGGLRDPSPREQARQVSPGSLAHRLICLSCSTEDVP
ncbi:TBC1D22B, partial [Cervus elaphus hippelaphus]